MKSIYPLSLIGVLWLLGFGWTPVHAGASNVAHCENEALRLADEGGKDAMDKAVSTIKKCLEQTPKRARSHVIYGDLLLKRGEYGAAEEAFNEALALRPLSAPAKTGKGQILAHEGKLDEAVIMLTDALKLNPDPSFTHYQLGLVYEKQGKLAEALSHYKEGISICERHRK